MKFANQTHYHDHGLMFAKMWEHLQRHGDTLGYPLQMNSLGQNEYRRLIKQAEVRPIKFHGLHHTCATLLLRAGVPIKVVQERLGHKRVEITLNIYAHALPSMQQDAAARPARLLHSQGISMTSLLATSWWYHRENAVSVASHTAQLPATSDLSAVSLP